MRWMGAGVACVMMASLVAGAQAATDDNSRLEAALQRQEPQRLVGALRLENSRGGGASRQYFLRRERRHSCLSHAGGRQRAAERVYRNRSRTSGLRAQPRVSMGREEIRAAHEPGARRRAHLSRASRARGGLARRLRGADPGRRHRRLLGRVLTPFQLRRSEDRPLCIAGKRRRAEDGGQRRQVRAHASQQGQRISRLEHARGHRARRPRHAHRQRRDQHARVRHQRLGRGFEFLGEGGEGQDCAAG